jgi:small GTP-binding protein
MGKGGVGKTSLVNRYVHQRFLQRYMQTLGEDVFSKKQIIDYKKVYVAIHDLAGQERFSPFRQTYLKGSQLGLAIFDLTMPNSIDSLKDYWIDDLTKVIDPNSKFFLSVVGNKSDLEKKVTDKDIKRLLSFIKKHYTNIVVCEYIETSAKENTNVDVSFMNLVNKFILSNKKSLEKYSKLSYSNDF